MMTPQTNQATHKLPRMTPGQFSKAKQLIRSLCANYDTGNCLLLDDGEAFLCPQLITLSLICRYFREAVLPADEELFAAITEKEPTGSCAVCGKPIYRKSNRTKYCPACKNIMAKQKAAARQRKHYQTSRFRA